MPIKEIFHEPALAPLAIHRNRPAATVLARCGKVLLLAENDEYWEFRLSPSEPPCDDGGPYCRDPDELRRRCQIGVGGELWPAIVAMVRERSAPFVLYGGFHFPEPPAEMAKFLTTLPTHAWEPTRLAASERAREIAKRRRAIQERNQRAADSDCT
jgi:hypothetical protein